jgi:membrane-associated phospholipid phosphatase
MDRSATPAPAHDRRRASATALLAVVLLALVGIAAIYGVSRGTDAGGHLDRHGLLEGFEGARFGTAHAASERFVRTVDRGALVVAGLAIGAIAIARRRLRVGAAALAAIAGANVSTQILKPLLGTIEPFDAARHLPAAFPSGHATVAMSVALALVLVVPSASRPLAALFGAGYAAAMGVGLLALGWHYPSDVAAGYLMATAWAAAAGAVALRWERPPADRTRVRARRAAAAAALLAAGAVIAAAALGVAMVVERPDVVALGRVHTTFFAASAAVTFAAAALCALVTGPLTAWRGGGARSAA